MFGGRHREVAVDRYQSEPRAASEPQAAKGRRVVMAEELRRAELLRDRLEGLKQVVKSYPEGHATRALLDGLDLDRPLQAVEEDIERLWDHLLYPRGT